MAVKKQEISVPYSWEEVPGTPKKNWKKKKSINRTSINSCPIKLLLPAEKFTVSIPFKWEEKPGTPKQFFISSQSKHLQTDSSPNNYWFRNNDEIVDELLYLEKWEESSIDDDESSGLDSSNCCYEDSGESSLIEWMFPLLSSRDSSLLEKGGFRHENVEVMNERKVFDEMNSIEEIMNPLPLGLTTPPPPTLGELMMMSQRQSYTKKTMDMYTNNFIKETKKKRKSFIWCINGVMETIRKTTHLNWTKQQRRPFKLM